MWRSENGHVCNAVDDCTQLHQKETEVTASFIQVCVCGYVAALQKHSFGGFSLDACCRAFNFREYSSHDAGLLMSAAEFQQ